MRPRLSPRSSVLQPSWAISVPVTAVTPSQALLQAEQPTANRHVPPLPLAGIAASKAVVAPCGSKSVEEDWLDRYTQELGHFPPSAVQLQAFAVSRGQRVPFGKAVKLLSRRRKARARSVSNQARRQRAMRVPLSMSARPTAVQAPLSISPRPTAIGASLPTSSRPTAIQVQLSFPQRPNTVQGDLLGTPKATSPCMQKRKGEESSRCCDLPPFAPWLPPGVASGCSEIEQEGDSDEPDFAINTPTSSEFEALVSSRWGSGCDPARTARSSSGGQHGPGPSCPPTWQSFHWQNQMQHTLLNVTEPLPVARRERLGHPAPEVQPFCAATAAAKAFLATQPERPISVAVLHARAAAGDAGGRESTSNDCSTATEMSLPSRGSALHCLGTCRPCAFVHQEGCRSGLDCEFCHLCDAGARRRLRRERLRQARAARAASR